MVPATDLVIGSESVHGHQTHGHSNRSQDHLPRMRGDEQAVEPEET